jgi:hypothetical protein
MLNDRDNVLADAQVLTATADSENYIDLQALGDGWDSLQIVVHSPTILDSAGDAATLQIILETDDNSSFSSGTQMLLTGLIPEASLTAGIIAKIPIPYGVERYIQLIFSVGTENFTSGTISAIVARPDNDNAPA